MRHVSGSGSHGRGGTATMNRAGIFGIILASMAMFAHPAAAGSIQRFTDSQGVIRITNAGGASQSAPAPAAPEPAAPQPQVVKTESPSPAAPRPDAAKPDAAAKLPESPASRDPDQNRVTPTPPAPAPVKTAQADRAEVPDKRLPIKPVSWSQGEPPQAGPEKAASVPKAAATPGGIRRYRDPQGVLHIENVSAQPPEPAAPLVGLQVSGNANPPPPEPPEASGARSSWPLVKASWDGTSRNEIDGREIAAARQSPGPMDGTIRRYRDKQGILRITNVAPENIEPAPQPRLRAEAIPGNPRDGPTPPHSPIQAATEVRLPVTRVSWEELRPASQRPPPTLHAGKTEAKAPGGIRRYRDAKGILHLESVAPAVPEVPQAPMPPPSQGIINRAYAGIGPPGALKDDGSGLPPPPTVGQIVAFKDKRGRLTIRNDYPQVLAGRAPPAGLPPAPLASFIQEAALAFRLPAPLIEALIKVESNFVPWAVSPKGAMGLMQLMPGTAEFLGVKEPFSPRENILGGSRYLRHLLDLFNGSLPLALAAYNAGYQRVISAGYQVPAIKETQDFVTQVLGRYYVGMKQTQQPWI